MSVIGVKEIAQAYQRAGAVAGDPIVYYGSMISIGHVEGGANAIIDGILKAGAPGAAAVGTFWYNGRPAERPPEKFDAATSPSCNGLMAEAMRLAPRTLRSDHFSHSVSAAGAGKEELTRNHGGGKQKPTPWNDEAFAEISPRTKFCLWNTLYTFIGVVFNICTMKHFLESRLVDHCLSLLPEKLRNEYRLKLAHDVNKDVRCFIDMCRMQKIYEEKELVTVTTLRNAKLLYLHTFWDLIEKRLTFFRIKRHSVFPGGGLLWSHDARSDRHSRGYATKYRRWAPEPPPEWRRRQGQDTWKKWCFSARRSDWSPGHIFSGN